MLRKTHTAVGLFAATVLIYPTTPTAIAGCLLASAIGSTIPDVDVHSSIIRKNLAKIFAFICISIVIMFGVDITLNTKFIPKLFSIKGISGYLLFIFLSILGMKSKHREGFTHSLLGAAVFSSSIWIMLPTLAIPFFISYLSHLVLDLLNKKKMRIFYPLKTKLALKLCSASGTVNTILFYIGICGEILLLFTIIISNSVQ